MIFLMSIAHFFVKGHHCACCRHCCLPGGDPLLINRIGARAHSLNFRNVFRRLTGQPLGD